MSTDIALFLTQDGIVNASVYALIALAIVLVFMVTRVLFVPQGEFVSYSALTLASLSAGKVPATVWIMLVGAFLAVAISIYREWRRIGRFRITARRTSVVAYAAAIAFIVTWLAPMQLPNWVIIPLTIAIIAPLGPIIYTVFFEGIASSPNLTLLIAAMALHYAMVGIGLVLFGAEGWRSEPISDASFNLGPLHISAQSVTVIAAAAIIMLALFVFFNRSIHGKALHETSISRPGAKLVGIRPSVAGKISFLLAALIGAASGILAAPLTTIYYDSGFLVGLKGFVAAIIGGLVSYPIAVLGAFLVGMLESFSSFWVSSFKEVIVFALIMPILLWRSLRAPHVDGE